MRTTNASLLLLATFVDATEGAFHEGITGSSLRFDKTWNQQQQNQKQQQQQQQQSRSSRNLQSFTGSTSARESCQAAKRKEEADLAPGGGASKCQCEQAVLDERYSQFLDMSSQPTVWELTCVDERCSYCSADGITCDQFSYGAIFEEVKVQQSAAPGSNTRDAVVQVGYFETNQYIVGRPEAVVYTEFNDPASPGSHACMMEIDGLQCAVCEYVSCSPEETEKTRDTGDIDIYYGLELVCSNILISDGTGGYIPALDFQTCEEEQIIAIGESQGVFEMYDPEYGQCYTSTEGCQRDKVELEQNGYYECACVDSPDQGVSPSLENVVLSCAVAAGIENDNQICNTLQRDQVERTFSAYAKETNTRTIQLESGSTLVVEEFDCLLTKGFSDGCSQCKASIDGTECDACEMVECDEGEILAPSLDCGNASNEILNENENNSEATTIINLCKPETSKGTPFEAFSECGFGESFEVPSVKPETPNQVPPPVSLMACNEKKNEFVQSTDNFVDSKVLTCECLLVSEDQSVDAGTLLECRSTNGACASSNGGSICNADYSGDENVGEGVCFREELVEGFLADGSTTPMTRTTTYTHGVTLGNNMLGRTLVLTEFGNGSKGCQLLVDGEACNSCELKNCGGDDIGTRPLVDCSNVVDDASFQLDTCEAFASYETGFLTRLTAGAGDNSSSNDFGYCRDKPSSMNAGDPSLPKICDNAQPIVLPTQEDDPDAISRGIKNPNSNFAFVSFVSSTKGLSLAQDELSSVQETCEEGNGSGYENSPGLWYFLEGTGKGIHASVCREAANFDARISIYKGTCDSMDCVASTPLQGSDVETSCDVHWVAEKGTTYYLRVHGTDDSQTGTFNLFLEPLDTEATDTCYSEETEKFDNACLSCSKAQVTRVQQFQNDPADIDCKCIQNEGTGGYHLTCVDLSCLKCNSRQDVCGFDTVEQEIKLSGEVPFGSYESFYFMEKAEGVQASELVTVKNTACLEIHDPYQQCMMAKEELMAKEEAEFDDTPFFCECRQTSPNGSHMLICSLYNSFEFCVDSDDGICADQVLFGQSISQYGSVTNEFRNYVITLEDSGESEEKSITIERFADQCAVSIDGEACSKCELLQTCVNNRREEDVLDIVSTGIDAAVFTDLSVDCSNLVEDTTATFECGTVDSIKNNFLSILGGSVLEVEGGSSNNNQKQTIPPDAFPPTLPPVTRPTFPPVNPPSFFNDEGDKGDENVEHSTNQTTDIIDSSAKGLMGGRTIASMVSAIAFASLFLLL